MDYNLAELVLKTAREKGATYAEARLEKSESSAFLLKNGIPHVSGYDTSVGIGLRVEVNGAMSFASTNNLDRKSIRQIVERAVKAAKSSSSIADKIDRTQASVQRADYKVEQKKDIRTVSPTLKLKTLQEIDKAILATKKSVPGRYLVLGDEFIEKFYINTEGTRITSEIPRTNFMHITTIKENSNLTQRYWQYGFSGGFETITALNLPKLLGDEVKILSENMAKGVKPPKGEIDMVVGPQVVGIIVHESAGHPGEADRIFGREAAQAGESFLGKDAVGTKIGSDIVTIKDDPRIKGSFGYYEYDDEGVKASARTLYSKGKIKDFLHDRSSSTKMNTVSNASARSCNYDREPIVRMANTYFEEGEYSEEELIEGVRNGVLMRTFMEWNIDDKRYNQKYVGAEAYLIKNGKIAGPVREPVLELTTPKLYSSVDAAANNTEFHAGTCGKGEPMQGIPVWFGGPSIRIRKVRLG